MSKTMKILLVILVFVSAIPGTVFLLELHAEDMYQINDDMFLELKLPVALAEIVAFLCWVRYSRPTFFQDAIQWLFLAPLRFLTWYFQSVYNHAAWFFRAIGAPGQAEHLERDLKRHKEVLTNAQKLINRLLCAAFGRLNQKDEPTPLAE